MKHVESGVFIVAIAIMVGHGY